MIDLTNLEHLSSNASRSLLNEIKEICRIDGPEEAAINWQGVAVIAGGAARSTLDLHWAETAIFVYEHLHSRIATTGNEGFLISAMMLRAFLIDRLGDNEDSYINNSRLILDWFLSSARITTTEAEHLCNSLQTRIKHRESNDDTMSELCTTLLELRKIKNRLNVLKLIEWTTPIQEASAMQIWFKLLDRLP